MVFYKAYAYTSQQSYSKAHTPQRNENMSTQETFVLYLGYGDGYTTSHVCQNSWNYILEIANFTVHTLYLNKVIRK